MNSKLPHRNHQCTRTGELDFNILTSSLPTNYAPHFERRSVITVNLYRLPLFDPTRFVGIRTCRVDNHIGARTIASTRPSSTPLGSTPSFSSGSSPPSFSSRSLPPSRIPVWFSTMGSDGKLGMGDNSTVALGAHDDEAGSGDEVRGQSYIQRSCQTTQHVHEEDEKLPDPSGEYAADAHNHKLRETAGSGARNTNVAMWGAVWVGTPPFPRLPKRKENARTGRMAVAKEEGANLFDHTNLRGMRRCGD